MRRWIRAGGGWRSQSTRSWINTGRLTRGGGAWRSRRKSATVDADTRSKPRRPRGGYAYADPTRMAILRALAMREPQTGLGLAASAGVNRGSVAHHIEAMERAGLVTVARAGRRGSDIRLTDAGRKLALDSSANLCYTTDTTNKRPGSAVNAPGQDTGKELR